MYYNRIVLMTIYCPGQGCCLTSRYHVMKCPGESEDSSLINKRILGSYCHHCTDVIQPIDILTDHYLL